MGRRPKIEDYYKIMEYIEKGYSTGEIAKYFKTSTANISKKIKKLVQYGLVRPAGGFGIYELTPKGERLLERYRNGEIVNFFLTPGESVLTKKRRQEEHIVKGIRIHALTLKFNIKKIIDPGKANKWEKKVEINNWIKEYDYIDVPFQITLEKTTRNIIAYILPKEFNPKEFFTEFIEWFGRILFYIYFYLLEAKGIEINPFTLKVTNQHIANYLPESFEKVVDEKTYVEVNFPREAKGPGGQVGNQQAKAWLDRSKGPVELETNDILYEEKLLLMPEKVDIIDKKLTEFYKSLDLYNKNIQLHLGVLFQIKEAIKELTDTIKELKYKK